MKIIMKVMRILICSLAYLLFAWGSGELSAQETNGAYSSMHSSMHDFMRMKLSYSQNIIEGITLENREMVITNAAKLMYMTRSNVFMEFKVPGYLDQTRKFQEDVMLLGTEARAGNNPGMLKAYAKVIGACLECHQTYRANHVPIAITNLATPIGSPGAAKPTKRSATEPANPPK